jgi:hypothetical protein
VLNDVDLIVNMSEDFWSLSPVEGRQHGILALFRAVENQRPVLRSTSSGFTVSIDATGRIQPGALEAYTAGYVVATVLLPEKRLTLYTRWGDWFPLSCAAILVLAGIFALARIVVRKAKSPLRPHFQIMGGPIRTDAPTGSTIPERMGISPSQHSVRASPDGFPGTAEAIAVASSSKDSSAIEKERRVLSSGCGGARSFRHVRRRGENQGRRRCPHVGT